MPMEFLKSGDSIQKNMTNFFAADLLGFYAALKIAVFVPSVGAVFNGMGVWLLNSDFCILFDK
jgi:hypothetical protein